MDLLPMVTNLVRRGMDVDPQCPQCGEDYESPTHLFLDCHSSKLMWKLSPFRFDVDRRTGINFSHWTCTNLFHMEEASRGLFLTHIWSLWKERNLWVFEKIRRAPLETSQKASAFLNAYVSAQETTEKVVTAVQQGHTKWTAPGAGVLKINVDAAMGDTGDASLGLVIRNHKGEFKGAAVCYLPYAQQSETMEAEAIRWGMKKANEMGISRAEIETDCQRICILLQKKGRNRSHHGVIVKDCILLSSLFESISFSWASRVCNVVADSVAKLGLSLKQNCCWRDEAPGQIMELIVREQKLLGE